MNHSWGVYAIRGRLEGGKETEATDKHAVSYFVRWRVDGRMRRRSFKTRGHANTFRDLLIAVIEALGVDPEVGWLLDSSLVIDDGVLVDDRLRTLKPENHEHWLGPCVWMSVRPGPGACGPPGAYQIPGPPVGTRGIVSW